MTESQNLVLEEIWINFQKAGESNPEHVHEGSDLSFVIYLKVPQQIRADADRFLSNRLHKGAPPGSILFKYGEYRDFAVDGRVLCPQENTILMWPSYLRHGVTPFDCDEIRISVAGNIKFLD